MTAPPANRRGGSPPRAAAGRAVSGVLGVRRPGHWTGRLEPLTSTEALSDESFVKILGSAARLIGSPSRAPPGWFATKLPTFRTGPAAARSRPGLPSSSGIDAGRIDVLLDADIVDVGGSLNDLALTVPQDLVVLSVESDGLTDWSRPDPRQLLLRYDRASARSRRRLKITGWIPVLEDPLKLGSQQLQVPTPWLEVSGMETVSATLIISSASRLRGDQRTRADTARLRGRPSRQAGPMRELARSIALKTPRNSAPFSGARLPRVSTS